MLKKQLAQIRLSSSLSLCENRKFFETKTYSLVSIKKKKQSARNLFIKFLFKYGLHQYWRQAQQYLVPLQKYEKTLHLRWTITKHKYIFKKTLNC